MGVGGCRWVGVVVCRYRWMCVSVGGCRWVQIKQVIYI